MAEISTAGIPEPDGDFGIWGVKNNKKVVQLIEGHNDHDGKIATNAADIAGLTEGVIPELTDAGIAAVLGTDGSASQAEVIAQRFGDVAVTYDGENVETVTDGPATTTYTYVGDLVDTDTTVIGGTTITRQYVYDLDGNLTTIEVI